MCVNMMLGALQVTVLTGDKALGLAAGDVLELDGGAPRRGQLVVIEAYGRRWCQRFADEPPWQGQQLYRVVRIWRAEP